jgi:hypothetical protein
MTLWSHPYPQNVLSKRRDLQDRVPASDLDAITKRPAAGNGLQDGELFRRGNRSGGVSSARCPLAECCRSEKNDREQSER